MMKSRKIFYWVGSILGGILLLLMVLFLAAPLIMNLDSVRGEVEARFHRETGGQGTFRALDLHILPRPHAVIRGGKLSFPGGGTFEFESVSVYPKLLPLLKGAFHPARVEFSSPRSDMDLSAAGRDNPFSALFSETAGKFQMPAQFHTLINRTGGLTIQVENGLLNLTRKGKPLFRFSDIFISAGQENRSLSLKLTCTSSLFEKMTMKGQLALGSFKTKGTLTLTGFKTSQLPNNSPDEAIRLAKGVMDLQMDFEGTGLESLKGDINLSAPSLVLWRGKKKITVKGAKAKGRMELGKGVLAASLSPMTLDYPRMDLSGVFKREKDGPRVLVHLEGKDVDVPAVRSCALALGDDISAVNNIFSVIRDGYVPTISVDARGKSLADLGDLKNYDIKGFMRRGKISLENPALNLTGVEGSALISKGILRGQRLLARLGKIQGRNGILTVALLKDDVPFHLNIQVDADLAQAHSVLKGLVTKGPFSEVLHKINSIEGRATATLKLDETKSGLMAEVDCSSCRMKTLYRPLSLPVTVKSGGFHYRRNYFGLRQLAGTYGQSDFFVASGFFDWQDEPKMEIGSAKGAADLGQVYAMLLATKGAGQWLKQLDDVKGRLSFHSLTLKGPLKTPAAWAYRTDFQVDKLFLDAAFLPGPLTAAKGRIQANTGGIRFSDAEINILDSDFIMTGRSAGPVTGIGRFETALSGTLGSRGMEYLYKIIKMPEDFLVNTPMRINQGRVTWEKGAGVTFYGNMLFPKGPSVSLDLSNGHGKLNIRKLTVEDDASRATFSLLAHEALVDMDFRGKLQKSTLDGMFAKNRVLNGWIEGNISARVLPRQSYSTSAEGFLAGKGIPVYGLALPATIEDFSLRTEGQLLRVYSARVALYENELVISGNADLSTENTRFDVDVSTQNVDLDKILDFLKQSESQSAGTENKDPWHFPIRGKVHLTWDSLKIGGYTWRPFQGEITVAPESIRVAVENSRLCDISSPGVLRINRDGIEISFRLKAEKSDLNRCITCLTKKRVVAEGTFELDARIEGKGNWANLFHNLEGPVVFSAAQGHVRQDPALAGVISVLSVTDIFQGKLPAFEKEGFPYDLVLIKGKFKDGKFHMHDGVLNSAAMDLVFKGEMDLLNDRLNMDMLASPFTLTDRLIRFIPVAGYILGGTLISVPVRIEGPLENPDVRILPLSEIGSGVWGIMKRTLETPVKLIEPLAGEENKTEEKEDK